MSRLLRMALLALPAGGLLLRGARRRGERPVPSSPVTETPTPQILDAVAPAIPTPPPAPAAISKEPEPRPGRTAAHALVRVPGSLAAGVLTGLIAAVVVPVALGAHPLTVMSGSMHPAIATGDAVVVAPIKASRMRVGEVVTFRDPHRQRHRLITHRVRGLERAGGVFKVVTRGDANNASEHWRVPVGGEVGKVVYRLPMAGYLSRLAASPRGRVVMVFLPLLLLGGWALVRIWRPAPRATSTSTGCSA